MSSLKIPNQQRGSVKTGFDALPDIKRHVEESTTLDPDAKNAASKRVNKELERRAYSFPRTPEKEETK